MNSQIRAKYFWELLYKNSTITNLCEVFAVIPKLEPKWSYIYFEIVSDRVSSYNSKWPSSREAIAQMTIVAPVEIDNFRTEEDYVYDILEAVNNVLIPRNNLSYIFELPWENYIDMIMLWSETPILYNTKKRAVKKQNYLIKYKA